MTARSPEQILEAARAIPEGFVRTYGDLSPGSPRVAGKVLHGAGGEVPWWRVVRADGSLPLGEDQRARLAGEGIPLLATEPPRVDMRRAHLLDDAHARASEGWRCFGDGDPLYERLSLEAFQSGLSWRTILARREAFRAAFAGFRPDVLARYARSDVARLLADAGIIRNRAKIEATLANARAPVALRTSEAPLESLIREHAPHPGRRAPAARADVPARTTE